jgi:hypothetical protein
VIAAIGVGLIAGPGRVDTAVIGFALLAGGMAPVVGLVQSAGQALWPTRKGAAASSMARYIYSGILAGPVTLGVLSALWGFKETASATSLQIALGCLYVLPIAVMLLAEAVRPARVEDAA